MATIDSKMDNLQVTLKAKEDALQKVKEQQFGRSTKHIFDVNMTVYENISKGTRDILTTQKLLTQEVSRI